MNNIDRTKIVEYLQATDTRYRLYDPGRYLYIQFCKREDYLSDEYIELLYVVLVAWGMNLRRASLSDFNVFHDSLIENKELIESLRNERLETVDLEGIRGQVYKLYARLNLVGNNASKFVTFSKTLHLLLPNLFVPMDRTYTLSYYSSYFPKDMDKHFEKYWNIMTDMAHFAQNNLSVLQKEMKSEGKSWNKNIPKMVDNILIGMKFIE